MALLYTSLFASQAALACCVKCRDAHPEVHKLALQQLCDIVDASPDPVLRSTALPACVAALSGAHFQHSQDAQLRTDAAAVLEV